MSYQREFNRKIKVGIIGLGSHCYRNILPLMNYLPVDIVAVCDINFTIANLTAKQYGCHSYCDTKEMYINEVLDAVFISVGPSLHPRLVCEALDAKVDVWVEKPIAVRASEVLMMMEHSKENIVVVGLKKAFMPSCDKIVEICKNPNFGHLKTITAMYPMTIEKNGREILENKETPNWLRNGVHPLSLMLRVGGHVDYVQTVCDRDGYGVVILGFSSGCIGTLSLCSGPKPDFEYYSFTGEGWRAVIDNAIVRLDCGIPFDYNNTTNYISEGFNYGVHEWSPRNCVATLDNKALFIQGFYSEAMYFCNCVLNKIKPKNGSLEFAYEIMQVYEAALLSDGKKIFLEGGNL